MPEHESGSQHHPEGEREHRRGAGAILFAGLIGSALGAAAAILLSPWRGSEARLHLTDRVKDLEAKAKDVASKVKDKLPCARGKEED